MYQSTHTGAQVDEAVDKVLASPISMMSNRNLLDNWFFANPVNQRGLTSYSTNDAYCIDRWKYYSAIPMTLQSDGIRLGDTTSNAITIIRQFIDNPQQYAGKTLTFSVLVKDLAGTDNAKGFIRWYVNNVEQTPSFITGELTTLTLTIPSSPTSLLFDIGSYWNNAFTAVSAKLEIGSVSTLANDAPPNFAEELAKCQRYFVRVPIVINSPYAYGVATSAQGTQIRAVLPLPTTMRTLPSATLTGTSIKAVGNAQSLSVSAVAADSIIPGGVISLLTVAGATQNQCYALVGGGDATLDFSADL